ncbi:MAG: amidohydrolase [Chitinophagales bacterium]|nr:amidohydrolase [Chitinophagales bacterium]
MMQLLFLLLGFTNAIEKTTVDFILYNGKIYTVDESFSIQTAVAINGDKIVATGNDAEIQQLYSAKNTIDLKGKSVYPGFIDAHCHFLGYGRNLMYSNLRNASSFDEILERLKTFDPTATNGWIIGRGWDQNLWTEKVFPDCKVLDSLFPNNPVYLIRIDGHAVLANTYALNLAGINNATNVNGGLVVTENNKCTGLLIDNAITPLQNLLPVNDPAFIQTALLRAQDSCFSVGLTSVQDAGLEKIEIDEIQHLQDAEKLKMRIYAMLSSKKETLDYYFSRDQIHTDYLFIGAVKYYMDGALGSRGAALLEPYSDDPDNSGLLFYTYDSLKAAAEIVHEMNYQMCTHAIGDAANRMVLNVYADVLLSTNDRRWRIEHCQIVNPDDLEIFKKYDIIPSIQTTHATSDMYWAEERLGATRIHDAYAYKSLLQQNGWLANGSDFPVEYINPLFGFYAAVARKDQNGYPENGFQKGEALTRKEALQATTIWAAKAAWEDYEKGSIEAGKFADLVILENDIMQIPEEEIFNTKVLMTISGGKIVYQKVNGE